MLKSNIENKIKDCLAVSENNSKMFAIADRIQNIATILAVLVLIFGLVFSLGTSFEESYSSSYYGGSSSTTVFNFGNFVFNVFAYAFTAAVVYGLMTGYAILIRCMAETSQNSLNTARLTELQITFLNTQFGENAAYKIHTNPCPESMEIEVSAEPEISRSTEEIREEISKLTSQLETVSKYGLGSQSALKERIAELNKALS